MSRGKVIHNCDCIFAIAFENHKVATILRKMSAKRKSKIHRARGAEVYYPMLCRNPKQTADQPVLSVDGRQLHPRMPADGQLVVYSEKERCYVENCRIHEGHRLLSDTIKSAWESLQTEESEVKSLRRLPRRDRYWKDEIGNYGTYDLPPADRKRIRHDHLVLQIVLHTEDHGLETGYGDAWCSHCEKDFLMTIATKQAKRALLSKTLRLGFADIAKFISSGGFVKCPLCGAETIPDFIW